MLPPTTDLSPKSVPDPPVLAVGALLSQARIHEANRRRYANQRSGKQHTPDYAKATAEAQAALSKRLTAHELDPDHTDPAWALDTVPSAEIVDFLTKWIPKP